MDSNKNSIFSLDQFKPYQSLWQRRQKVFGQYWQHYKQGGMAAGGDWKTAMGQMMGSRIQNAVKPIFTPLARAVNVDVALIPGGWRLSAESAAAADWFNDLLRASAWRLNQRLFVRFYAAMGESGLRVVDDREEKTVKLMPVRPDRYFYVGAADDMKMLVEIDLRKNGGDTIENATVYTAANVEQYEGGKLMRRWENALGHIPMAVAVNDMGDGQPQATFDDVLPSLYELNTQATYMALIIQRHFEPQWAAFGADATDLTKDGESVWFFPEGSDIKALLAAVDFAGLLAFVQAIKDEMKESLPELAFAKLVGANRVATDTIELEMGETVFKIQDMRGPVDIALERAAQLAAVAGRQMKIAGVIGEDVAIVLDDDRPVIRKDALTMIRQEAAQLGLDRERAMDVGN